MRAIIAVALSVMKEIWRLRLLVIFVFVFLLLCTGGFALWLHASDGLANEKLQTFIGYSLRFITWFLSLFTIFVSVVTITRDIKNHEIYTITTKPITRGQYLLGKLAGVSAVTLVLLAVSVGAIYGLVRLLEYTEPVNDVERARIRELVLIAREGVKPILPDVSQEARTKARQLVEDYAREQGITDPGHLAQLERRTYEDVTKQLVMRYTAIEPSRAGIFHFIGIKPLNRTAGYLIIRYKQEVSQTPQDQSLVNLWMFGPKDPQAHGGAQTMSQGAVRTVHELPVDIRQVSPEGEFYLAYYNTPENNTVVIFPPDNGLEALYAAGYFEGNMARSAGLIYIRLIFLSILGLAAGAWVSMPVAILVSLVVYFLGLSTNFILDAVSYDTGMFQANAIRFILQFFPNLSAVDPIGLIERGRLVSAGLVGEAVVFLLIIKGGVIAAVGYAIFRFRELARVIV